VRGSARAASGSGQRYALRLQKVSFVVGDYETQGIAQAEMKQWNEMKRDPDPEKVLGGRVTEDIVQRVAFALKAFNHGSAIFFLLYGANRFCRFHFQDGAVGAGHDLFINPVSYPAAALLIGFGIGRQGDTGKNAPDIDIVSEVEVIEYFHNAPLPGGGRPGQLIGCQAKKGLRPGFDQFSSVQQFRYQTLPAKN
jgi:hypothetical protein